MSSRPDINQLILKIHSTVMEPAGWSAVMSEIAQAMGADSAMLFSVPDSGSEPYWNVMLNLDSDLMAAYPKSFVVHDEWLRGAQRLRRDKTGIVSVGEQLLDRTQFLRSVYYNEFLKGLRVDRFANVCLSGPSQPGQPPETGISFYREPGKDAFSQAQAELLSHLAPHLVLAVRNLSHARSLALRSSAFAQTLDQLTAMVYAIDGQDRLVYSNQAADVALKSGQWLVLKGDLLTAAKTIQDAHAVGSVFSRLRRGLASTLLLNDWSGTQAMLATAPISFDRASLIADHAIGVVWIVPLKLDCAPATQLAKLFKLTPAEARLLRLLARGDNLKSAAGVLNITANTARAQLKSIFRKTGRRTQGELLALVQRMSVIMSG